MFNFSKRAMVRMIAFPVAIITAMSVLLYTNEVRATAAKRTLEHSYMRSIEELSYCLDNIKTTLNKGMYSNSPQMMNELSSRLSNDAAAAKACISQLPVSELNLANTYKFLSQVGNYSKAMAKRISNGEELTAEDKENIVKLYDFSKTVSDNMWNVEKQLQGGFLTFERVKEIADDVNSASDAGSPAHVTDGFKEIEDTFDEFPMLIYDGPFSDHIMQKNPLMLSGEKQVDQATAARAALNVSGVTGLEAVTEEGGKMPSYVFKAGNTTVAITKAGGYLSYMLNYREIDTEKLTVEQSLKIAANYLKKLGITEFTNTYYETRNGVCIINFAGVQDGVTLYTDLIKVGVAMDAGEVISYDARGYLTNHTTRNISAPKLTDKEAAANLSQYLSCESVQRCIIPTSGMNEKHCYELKCRNSTGQQILVYINADTGEEEQILLLEIGPNGVLTV